MSRLTPEQLEQKIHAVLRDQPSRRAPVSLEGRVMGEIARRQAMPWWHKSYAYWPTPVRVAFVVLGVALVVAGALGSMQLAGVLSAPALMAFLQPVVNAMAAFKSAAGALGTLVRGMAPSINPQWWYVGLGVVGAAYATMIGLGATAYRLLWQHR